jgi:hypothetical protein
LNPRKTRLAPGALLVLFGGALARPCGAADACSLEVTGKPTPEWDRAVGSLDLEAGGDCAAIRLALGSESTLLTFVTSDGRRAERELHEPSELRPTLDALRVTGVPAEPSAEASTPVEAPAPAPVTIALVRMPARDTGVDRRSDASSSEKVRTALSLELGVRGGGNALVSPLLLVGGSVRVSRMELGVWGALEPVYGSLGGQETKPADEIAIVAPGERRPLLPQPVPEASAVAAGILAGKRWRYKHFDLFGAGRLGVAALMNMADGRDRAEVRLGAIVGLVFPPRKILHFRSGLALDVVPNELFRNDDANVPAWALSGTLGVEVGGS